MGVPGGKRLITSSRTSRTKRFTSGFSTANTSRPNLHPGGGSNASYAIRFAAGQEGMLMVLSGMGNMDMMNDNLSYMQDFQPLNEQEMEAVWKVADILIKQNQIACTACQYCVAGCPAGIKIPDLKGENLASAVIMSEILGKPKALRR